MIILRVLNVFLNNAGLGLYYKNEPLQKLNSADGKHLYGINSPSDKQLQDLIYLFNKESGVEDELI